MLYEPLIYSDRQILDYWLLSDPVIYAWAYWQQQDVRDTIYTPLEIRRKAWDLEEFSRQPFTSYRFGVNYGNRRDDLPFVAPPVT